MTAQLTVPYPTFAAFAQAAKEITKGYRLSTDLVKALHALRDFLGDTHFDRLVSDLGHGFNHALFVVHLALDIVETCHVDIDRDLVACGALLHDVYEVMDRKNHERKGAGLAWTIVRENPSVFGTVNPETIADVVRSHNQTAFKRGAHLAARLVRDADTLHEGLDLQRIVWIGGQKCRPFYDPDFGSVRRRIKVLASEDPAITEAEQCDVLMFLLRNVTKSIDPAWFVTRAAKAYIEKQNVKDKNTKELCDLIHTYVRRPAQQGRAKSVVENVMAKYWTRSSRKR